ncbi:RNA-directed DNA polymerase from mobile element jockey [Trichonephila clavipes]|uniref:RNA-directed DNA polymerase from mobile element jockey n=1 Tax=Trichonephila clavipes TaxID=2585209 RepID=A0A8X6WC24_TRICX|nr:RNA-directed DNA polymerase from mobile element jockey [Trichonephila clavipes]
MDSSQPAELQDQVVVPEMSGRFLKVTVGDELEYRNLSHWLEQTGVEFKSFMLKQDRPIKVVIRGLPSNTEPEDIKNEIEAEEFKVVKISQMKNYRSKAPMPLFYLQFENGAEALKIYDFTELFGTRIEVKPFERGNKVNQCWRCQGWFHSSEVCHLPPRCVKCAGPHSAKDCTLDFNDQMKCANCSGAHAANWSRCPKHPNNAKKKNQSKNKNGPNKPKNVPPKKTAPQAPRPDISKARKVSPNLDYSKVVQNQIPREHETWLEPGIDPQIANYRLFKDDRIEFPHTVTRGGTAIYCKNEIVHNRVPLPATPGIDATAVQIKIKNAPPLNIISAYIRKSAQSRFPSEDFKKIFNSGSNCIIAGDFNASHVDWHNVKNTRYGVSLRNLVSNLRGAKLVAPQTATHLQPRQRFGSIIDLAVFKHIPYNHSVRVLSDLSSDHYPVILEINLNTSNEKIELAISELNQNFSEAFVEASKPKFKNAPKILSPEIKSEIHQRNRLRKFWQRSRCPSIYSEFRTLSREIAKDIKSHSQAQWEKHIEALSPEDNTLWRNSSLLRKPFRSIPPLKGALGSTAITPIEKAEVIADSLQEQFEPNHVADREVFDQRIHEEVANFLATPHVQEFEPTTPTEVLTYVQRIKPKKSPGLDQISNRMLKNLPLKFLLFITFLINQLFKNNYFPDSWKTAVVIPILKPDKNPDLAQNYRPISLLSCLSKVYEFVLMQRLNQHCAAVNFIIPQQCGFRPKCSTVHQLLRVTELIHSGFAKHEATGILFLDIAKAFDKIWHDGLLIKLIRLDFPAPLIKSIHSFLSHRSFRVRVDRILSSPRPIRSGLPQGSLSSPLLFTLYVNDIPQTDSSHLAMFADDTAVISQNKRFSVVISNLQHYISSLELWLNDWKIKVNASKSACLMFTRRSRLPVGLTPVTIFGQPVPWVNVARYLGLFLDAKLTFAYHIEQTRKKALAVHAMLKRLISRRSKLTIRHKVLLYKSIIRPVMCYGSQIFGSAGMCHLKKLHTLTNSFLRQLVNAPWFIRNEVIYRDLKIKPFLPNIKDLSKRF